MKAAMDIEAKAPLLEKGPYPDADMATTPSLETAFPMRERLEEKFAASMLTLFSLVDMGAEGQEWTTLPSSHSAPRVQS
jgi:hypothetical protein